jgi:hypothetical protein
MQAVTTIKNAIAENSAGLIVQHVIITHNYQTKLPKLKRVNLPHFICD